MDVARPNDTEPDRRIGELERLVGERTAELEVCRNEMTSLVYAISHDLQAPLRSILGFAGILEEESAGRLEPEGRQHLARISAAAADMNRLIEALLGLSRAARAALRRRPTDLGAIAEIIAAELQVARPDRSASFVIAPGLTATADPELMRIALEQLLGNAWKFTRRHPAARIEFGAAREGGEPAFFVRDDGAGFDPACAGRLFTPFQRLHRADEFEGAGVGLATVRRIIQRHGGRIWAEAAVERGATFYFTLPGS